MTEERALAGWLRRDGHPHRQMRKARLSERSSPPRRHGKRGVDEPDLARKAEHWVAVLVSRGCNQAPPTGRREELKITVSQFWGQLAKGKTWADADVRLKQPL